MQSADFNFLDDTRSLDSDGQPFAWLGSEDMNPDKIEAIFEGQTQPEQLASLRFCMMFYMLHRRKMYCSYMAGAKRLFDTCKWDLLRAHCKLYHPHTESLLTNRGVALGDWCPQYELQRLAIYTGIHWTWLHWAWVQCERVLWKSGQTWQIQRLERIRPT